MPQETDRRISFFKMTGSGNDFIVIDNRARPIDADKAGNLVRLACRRKFSAGADGLILIEKDPQVDFKWRFFNADGSEAEMCGNGARCAARFACLKGIVSKSQMVFRTLAGLIEAEVLGKRVRIRVTPPHSLQSDFHLEAENHTFCLHSINTGVPHVVHLMEDDKALENMDVFHWGRVLRYHPRFQPAGSNINFATVHNPNRMAIRTYERGVEDETLACGTGSIASALVAAAQGRVFSPVEVLTRSGENLTIHFDTQKHRDDPFSEVYLEGDAKVVYEAELWNETIEE